MEKATISQLKNHLSAYLKKVRAGRSVLIVDRDEPVARLEHIRPGDEKDDRLSRLEKAGLMRRASRALDLTSLRAPAPTSQRSVLEALLEGRAEER